MTQAVTMLGKQAVLDGLAEHPAVKAMVAWNADALTDAKFDRDELTLTVTPESHSRGLLRPCATPATTSSKI